MTAPFSSVTVPLIVPVICAIAGQAINTKSPIDRRSFTALFIINSP
jgi:hypothetical protein